MNFQVQQAIYMINENINLLMPYAREYQYLITTSLIFLIAFSILRYIRAKRIQLEKAEKAKRKVPSSKPAYTLSKKDIEMVAGEDVVTTQLDLARAYMEMGKNNLAKSILYHVSKQGKPEQKQEAERLLNIF